MNHRERFYNLMHFKPVDRLPVLEWAGYWDQTIARWKQEGLPANLNDSAEIRDYFGQDPHRQLRVRAISPSFPSADYKGKRIVTDMDSYRRIKSYLYPMPAFDQNKAEQLERWTVHHRKSEWIVWLTLDGFFWFPRCLLGIEEHLVAFYDQPQVMHAINRDLVEFNLRVLDEVSAVLQPDFMTFAEDMSYNHGPMISKAFFDEFMAPYYQQIVPRLLERDITPFIDSDGLIDELVPWFAEVGVEGFLPLERQAGVDLARLRQKYPSLKFIGGYDKIVMSKGESEMRREFERLLPVMKQGGYLPSVDHQTPPEVSIANYRLFMRLLKEYCRLAV